MELNDNGLIYEIQLENGIEVARYIKCAYLHLNIECADTVAVNQEVNVTLAYLDYHDNPQNNSDKMTIEVIYDGEVVAAHTLTPVQGTANLLLEFAGPGEYTIAVSSDCTCEPAAKKVMVSG